MAFIRLSQCSCRAGPKRALGQAFSPEPPKANQRSRQQAGGAPRWGKKPPVGFEPTTSRLLSGCSAN